MKGVTLSLDKAVYSAEALELASFVFADRAEVTAAGSAKGWKVTLKPLGKVVDAEAVAGDFVNELLNAECRFLVSGVNKTLAALQTTQALFAARGGEDPLAAPAEDAVFRKETKALMDAARKER